MCSSSELQRVSVSASHILAPSGIVKIAADARPKEEVVKAAAVEEVKKEVVVPATAAPVGASAAAVPAGVAAPVATKVEETTKDGTTTTQSNDEIVCFFCLE